MMPQKNMTPICPLCSNQKCRLHIPGHRTDKDQQSKQYACSSMGHGDHNDIYFCESCQHGFLFPFPSDQELEELYASVQDPFYMEEIEGRVQTFANNLNILRRFSPGPKLLEVGSYCGIFLNSAQKSGYEVTGLEPSHWARTQALNHYGLKLHEGFFCREHCDKLVLSHTKHDVIVAWDVLEHVEDPKAFIQLSHELLRNDGLFVFSTVNIHSVFTKLLGRKWPWYMQMHLHYFTLRGLKKLLEEHGYKVLETGSYQHVVSLKYFGKKLHSLTGWPFDRWLSGSWFSNLFIPFRFGDIVYFVAQKRETE
jgi:2-polyprenyl-3-methyl-5-hydroxy-6-metoxy-1,4-benzoquinol methylase